MYSKAELIELFRTPTVGDASMILRHQLVAALLNATRFADVPDAAADAISDAQSWMATYNDGDGLPYGVAAHTEAGQLAIPLATALDMYNNGLFGTPKCD